MWCVLRCNSNKYKLKLFVITPFSSSNHWLAHHIFRQQFLQAIIYVCIKTIAGILLLVMNSGRIVLHVCKCLYRIGHSSLYVHYELLLLICLLLLPMEYLVQLLLSCLSWSNLFLKVFQQVRRLLLLVTDPYLEISFPNMQ